ncbi:MAG TPA: hypothetical protein VGP07_05735 [Polyangia bacterium]|jgi:hypothetical protein
MAKTKIKQDPRNALTGLVLVFPLLLLYQVGVVLIYPLINGADFLTRFLFHNVGLSRGAYLGYTALVAVVFAVIVAVLSRRQHINLRIFVPVLLESAIYALTMGSLIVFVMTRVFGINPRLAVGLGEQGLIGRVVMSLGAGFWEETTFRLGILGATAALCERVIGMRHFFALLVALAVSSFLFSAAHHIPPYGDPLHLGVFTFRLLAGAFFGLLFWFRGFAVAAYTHALYDIYVLIVKP